MSLTGIARHFFKINSKDLLRKNMNTLDTAELIHLKMVKTINATLKKFYTI